MHDACMFLHPCVSSFPDERIADAGPPYTRAHVLRPCARVQSCAHASAPAHASAFPSASTAGGSARRRSARRRRSTRTSARGTPRLCRTWTMYAPPFRPGRRVTAGGTRSAVGRCGAGRRARRRRRCARACVCADVWARACAGVHVCRYSCAYERRDIRNIYIYIYTYICMHYQ